MDGRGPSVPVVFRKCILHLPDLPGNTKLRGIIRAFSKDIGQAQVELVAFKIPLVPANHQVGSPSVEGCWIVVFGIPEIPELKVEAVLVEEVAESGIAVPFQAEVIVKGIPETRGYGRHGPEGRLGHAIAGLVVLIEFDSKPHMVYGELVTPPPGLG